MGMKLIFIIIIFLSGCSKWLFPEKSKSKKYNVKIIAGRNTTFIIQKNGTVLATGDNGNFADGAVTLTQLGILDPNQLADCEGKTKGCTKSWIKVPFLENILDLKSGVGHSYTYALAKNGNFYGIGYKENIVDSIEWKLIKKNVKTLSAGLADFYVINDDRLFGFGDNYSGQFGNGRKASYAEWTLIDTIEENVVSIDSGLNHSLMLKNNVLYVTGNNSYGQIAKGNLVEQLTWDISMNNIIRAATSSVSTSSYIVKSNGDLYVSGYNKYYQLGIESDGGPNNIKYWQKVETLNNIVDIKAGHDFAIALKSDGTVFVTGANNYGQLGILQEDYPGLMIEASGRLSAQKWTRVRGLNDIIAISAKSNWFGFGFSLALKKDGTLYGTGSNNYNQLGPKATGICGTQCNEWTEIYIVEL